MDTGMLHTHKLSVMLFLVLYLFKLIFLLTNNRRGLDALQKKGWRIFDMAISTVFLATGIYLMVTLAQVKPLIWVKVGIVLLSIPLAVVGFKKSNKPLALLSVVLLFAAYGLAEVAKKQLPKGEAPVLAADASRAEKAAALYTTYCAMCHGASGDMGFGGATNLQTSKLSESEIAEILLKGKNRMQSFAKLPEDERKMLAEHILTLRK
jgi:mono/diheme cytochrome c family protein